MDFVKEYLNWLKDEMAQEQIDDHLYEITTPFLDHHNDHTQFYIFELEDGSYKLTDNGNTLLDLEINGVSLTTPKRKQVLESTLMRFGVKQEGRDLYVISPSLQDLPRSKHSLLQAMLAVNDMFYLFTPQISSFFNTEL